MNGCERILAHLEGKPMDCLPAMPITMTFAARGIGAPYLEYCTDDRVQVQGQIWVAETYDIDYVSPISDPAVIAGLKERIGERKLVEGWIKGRCAEAGDCYIVGAGCEVPRDTPDENLRALAHYAREHAPQPYSE